MSSRNQARYELLWEVQKEAKRALDMHNKRRNLLLTVTGTFFFLMVTGIVSGFIWNLGNGIIGANIVAILFFIVSAFFTGMWVFDGWDGELEEKYEKAKEEFNKFMAEEG